MTYAFTRTGPEIEAIHDTVTNLGESVSLYSVLRFDNVQDMISGGGFIDWSNDTIGTQASTGKTLWEQVSFSSPMTDLDFKPLSAVDPIDYLLPSDLDSTSALNQAFAWVDRGAKVVITDKHTHSGVLSVVTSKFVDIQCEGDGEIITDPSITDSTALWISHLPYNSDTSQYFDPANRVGGSSLAVSASRADRQITVSNGSLFSKGQHIYIISTQDWLASANIKKGENRKINEVNGNVITLDGGLDDDYTSGITTCYPYDAPVLNVRLRMSGADDGNDLIGVHIYECSSIDLDHLTVSGYNLRDVQVDFTVGGFISNPNNDFSDKSYSTQNRSSYSLLISSSRDIAVAGGALRGGRHAFSTGGYIPNYNLTVDGVTCYSADSFGNDVACFDSHEGTVNMNVENCTIYGGVDCAGENLDISNNDIYLSGEQLRALVLRQYRNCDYMISDNNNIFGVDCAGGAVYRPRADNLNLNKLSQMDNSIIITTSFNRPGLGIEPTGFTGCRIRNLHQDNNYVDVRGTATLAVGIGNYDISDLTSLVDVRVSSCSGNDVYNECGVAVDHYFAEPEIANYKDNRFESAVSTARAVNIRNIQHLSWSDNHSYMSAAALAANSSNLFRDVEYLDIDNGSFTNSYYNGYRLIDVDNHNPVNVKRINCVANPSDFTRVNSKNTPHSWACVDGATGNPKGETLNCTISKQGSGHYRMTFIERQINGTDYPVFVSPESSIGYTVTRINFNAVDVIFDGNVDTNFSIETR